MDVPLTRNEQIGCDAQHSNTLVAAVILPPVRHFYVYIVASKSRVLYTGVTNDIQGRVWDHKNDANPGFTRDYRVHRLVYYETFQYVGNAIAREKQIKGWLRRKRLH
jgi:putative endonuclease